MSKTWKEIDRELRESFIVNLVRLREQIGLSQAAAAEEAGFTSRTWQRIETGEVRPTLTAIAKVAAALGVSPWDLLNPRKVLSTRKRRQAERRA